MLLSRGPNALHRALLALEGFFHRLEGLDHVLDLIAKFGRGEVAIEHIHLLILTFERILDLLHRDHLLTECNSEWYDVAPLSNPDILIQSEVIHSIRQHIGDNDRDSRIDAETIFLELLDPTIRPSLGVLRFPGDDTGGMPELVANRVDKIRSLDPSRDIINQVEWEFAREESFERVFLDFSLDLHRTLICLLVGFSERSLEDLHLLVTLGEFLLPLELEFLLFEVLLLADLGF